MWCGFVGPRSGLKRILLHHSVPCGCPPLLVDVESYWITPRNGLGWGTETMGEAGVGMGDARPAAAALAPKGVGEKATPLHLRV